MWLSCLCFLFFPGKGQLLSPNSAIVKLIWVGVFFLLIQSEVGNNTGTGLSGTWLKYCRYKEFLWAYIRPVIIWVLSFASCAVWYEENDLNQFSWKSKKFALFVLYGFYYKSFKCFNCCLYFHWKKVVYILVVYIFKMLFTFSLENVVKQHFFICSRLMYPMLALSISTWYVTQYKIL